MDKIKKIAAICGVILIVGIYFITFISVIFDFSYSSQLFQVSIYCTVVIPTMIYVYLWIYKLIHKDNKSDKDN